MRQVILEQQRTHINTITIKFGSSVQRGSVGELICPLSRGLPSVACNTSTGGDCSSED